MRITRLTEQDIDWNQVDHAILHGEFQAGDTIRIERCDWKVLDTRYDSQHPDENRILLWKRTGITDYIFNKNNSNVYENSDIQEYLRTEFHSSVPEEMLQRITDEDFFLPTRPQIITLIPYDMDRVVWNKRNYPTCYWTATRDDKHDHYVCIINSVGHTYDTNANGIYGVAPLCWMQIRN